MATGLAAIGLAALGGPAGAAVWEVGDDGSFLRVDAPVTAASTGHAGVRQHDARSSFRPAVESASRSYEVSSALVDAIAHVESRYRAVAVSRAGATGVMQLMPGTAKALGVDATVPEQNIRGGTAYLRQLLNRFDGDLVRTVAAYNAGPGAVARAGGVPAYAETRAYVAAVLDRLAGAAR